MRKTKWVVMLQYSMDAEGQDKATKVYVVRAESAHRALRDALDTLASSKESSPYLLGVNTWIHGLALPDGDARLTGAVNRPLAAVQELSNEELTDLLS